MINLGYVALGRTRDLARLRDVDAMFEQRFPDLRPELLGYLVAVHDNEDGAFTLAAYFTSEQAARAGERGNHRRRPPSCCGRRWSLCRT